MLQNIRRNQRPLALIVALIGLEILILYTAGPQQFDGHRLYNQAFNDIHTQHLYLLSPDKLKAFDAEWKHKHDHDQVLNTEQGTDQAIREMLQSVGCRFDQYHAPGDPVSHVQDGVAGLQANIRPGRMATSYSSVFAKSLGNGIYWIHVNDFDSNAVVSQFADVLKKCVDPKGLIIDLSYNPGGLVQASLKIAQFFIPSGTIFVGRQRGDWGLTEKRMVLHANYTVTEAYQYLPNGMRILMASVPSPREPLLVPLDLPVAVVVNDGTASAAEMLAANLQRHRGAKVVGKPTFGKGIFQQINRLPYGREIDITTGEYRVDEVTRIHGAGVKPDLDGDPNSPAHTFNFNKQIVCAENWLLWENQYQSRVHEAFGLVLPPGNQWILGPPEAADRTGTFQLGWCGWFILIGAGYLIYCRVREYKDKRASQSIQHTIGQLSQAQESASKLAELVGAGQTPSSAVAPLLLSVSHVGSKQLLPMLYQKATEAVLQDTANQASIEAHRLIPETIESYLAVLMEKPDHPGLIETAKALDRALQMMDDEDANGGHDAMPYLTAITTALDARSELQPAVSP